MRRRPKSEKPVRDQSGCLITVIVMIVLFALLAQFAGCEVIVFPEPQTADQRARMNG